jgi:hypothetical protein
MASVDNKTTVESSNLTLHLLLPLPVGILNLCAPRDKSLGVEIWVRSVLDHLTKSLTKKAAPVRKCTCGKTVVYLHLLAI